MRIDRLNLDIVFRRIPPECVQESIISASGVDTLKKDSLSLSAFSISESVFVRLANDCFDGYSKDERLEQYKILKERMVEKGTGKQCVFNLLFAFANNTLTTNRYIPECKYSEILRWQDTTHKLGQDLFTTAYLAFHDVAAHTQNTLFAWSPIIDHDNTRLKHLLSQGLAENHYHLNGSSQSFPISWVLIMNHPEAVYISDTLGDDLEHHLSFGRLYNTVSWSVKLFWAVAIRLHLFRVVHGSLDKGTTNPDASEEIINRIRSTMRYQIDLQIYDLKKTISLLRTTYGHVARYDHAPLDYALEKTMEPSNFQYNRILAGERKLMYDCFFQICNHTMSNQDVNLFYLYLLIKSNFRSEFIQTNNDVGFLNFEEYQKRKSVFYAKPMYSDYANESYRLSLNAVLNHQPICSLETRIMPNKNHQKIAYGIRHIDEIFSRFEHDCNPRSNPYDFLEQDSKLSINRSCNNYFFVLHYPKKKDCINTDLFPSPRNYAVREQNKQYTKSLFLALSRNVYLRDAILGIDACSNEIGCRPEVFAVDFRCMRTVIPQNKSSILSNTERPTQLNITYHVGEDFLDLVDGLRAMDECIHFLGMGQGDRFGHALALGVDAYEYYKLKDYRILIPKQDLLDDDVWILHIANKMGIHISPELFSILQTRCEKNMEYIYEDLSRQCSIHLSIHNYYNAWKLRGDAPELYKSGKFNESDVSFWGYDKNLKNSYLKEEYLRQDVNASRLYYGYHYNTSAKKRSNEIEVVKITDSYIHLVMEIQKAMQFYIAKKGIMLECNPTSNYLIGSIAKYDKHPLTVFNNLSLESNENKQQSCAQLSVSINTDDQGVFDTSLCNEYALMSAALENKKDDSGKQVYAASQVYEYINSVRKMGLEQSFLEKEKLILSDSARFLYSKHLK